MTGVEMFTILGGMAAITAIGVTIIFWIINKLDGDIKAAVTRMDANHQCAMSRIDATMARIDSNGARIDAVHDVIIQMITQKRD